MTVNVTDIHCDECDREMAVAHRVYKERRYCVTCYSRVFKRRMCQKCGNYARLHKNIENAICGKCEIDKPCVRCGKTEYAIGKITPYGPACSSCAPYFREMRPCGVCGTPSYRLTRVKRLGIEVPACPKCVRPDHATCPACHRHRLLQSAPDGRLLCKICVEQGEIPCPSCNKPMPAGRGKLCEVCYWQNAFRRRLKLNQAGFNVPEMQTAFGELGEWLLSEVGENKAAISIHKYLPFFVEIEKRFGKIPGYADLLAHFGAESLRRVRLPMSWLKEKRNIVPDVQAREEDSVRRQIDAIVASIPIGSPASKTLTDYQDRLVKRLAAGKSSLRSVRLALRPAASLLLLADKTGAKLPDQTTLDRYLVEAPGQKAAITGFVNFLNEQHGLALVSTVNVKQVSEVRRKKLEAELIALVRNGGEGEDFRRRWLSLALAYFHGLPKGVGKTLKDQNIVVTEGNGVTVSWNDANYWIPQILLLNTTQNNELHFKLEPKDHY